MSEDTTYKEKKLTMISGGQDKMNFENQIRCYRPELISIDYLTLSELFYGFQTIKAITFSYDVNFINQLMQNFEYGKIILGAIF